MLLRVINLYVYSNLHIALCAAVYVYGAQYIANSGMPSFQYSIFIGGATLICYNLHRYIGLSKTSNRANTERFNFLLEYKTAIVLLSTLALMCALYSLQTLNIYHIYWLIFMGIITTLYLLPIFHNKKRLRDLPYIKIIAIAIVWSGIFVIPLTSALNGTMELLLIFSEKAFFIFALTLPFDVRDLHIDRKQKVKTLATRYEFPQMKNLIIVSIVLCMSINLILFSLDTFDMNTLCVLLLFYFGQTFLCVYGLHQRSEMYYLGILDGLILIQGLLYLI